MTDDHGPGAGEAPEPQSFDPEWDQLPGDVLGAAATAAVVLLLDTTRHGRWAAESAVAAAAAWAAAGRRIVLADLHLEDPVLHEWLGQSNQDGIVDIFLYGASITRSARPVAGKHFYLIPAGTYTPDAATLFEHPRWEKLVIGFRDAGATLVAFARGDTADALPLLQWADSTIVLGTGALHPAVAGAMQQPHAVFYPTEAIAENGEPSAAAASDLGDSLAADDEPATPGEDAVSAVPDPDREPAWDVGPQIFVVPVDEGGRFDVDHGDFPGDADAGEELSAGDLDELFVPDVEIAQDEPSSAHREERARGTAGAAEDDTAWLEPLSGARMGQRRRHRRGSGVPAFVWVVLVVAVLAVGLYYLLAVLRPELVARDPVTLESLAASNPAGTEDSRPLSGESRPYAIQVGAYRSLSAALSQVAQRQAEFPDQRFYVTAEPSGNLLYYKVLAGLLADTAAAGAVRERLVEARAINPEDAGGDWALIQMRPLGFDLGSFPTREAASAFADSLVALGIPSYSVPLIGEDGGRWQLYGGAFRDSASAGAMQELLANAGIEARLAERVVAPAGDTL